MPTAVQRQVNAYRDSVMEASNLAVTCWDNLPAVQELILLGPGIANAAHAAVAHGPQDSVSTLKVLLVAMGAALRMGVIVREHDFKLDGIDEFNEAMRQIRFFLADAMDAENTESAEVKSYRGCDSPESFQALAKESGPPQSWYDEDFKGVRGPTLK